MTFGSWQYRQAEHPFKRASVHRVKSLEATERKSSSTAWQVPCTDRFSKDYDRPSLSRNRLSKRSTDPVSPERELPGDRLIYQFWIRSLYSLRTIFPSSGAVSIRRNALLFRRLLVKYTRCILTHRYRCREYGQQIRREKRRTNIFWPRSTSLFPHPKTRMATAYILSIKPSLYWSSKWPKVDRKIRLLYPWKRLGEWLIEYVSIM